MATDVDDVPWKYDLVTTTSKIVDGHITVLTAPGWGADLN
jgi:L-alanine-DL-glutamate epimerase-like enolase superfamily enzyme